MEDFKTWLRIYDYENDCAIPEEFIPALHDAFVAGGGGSLKRKKILKNLYLMDLKMIYLLLTYIRICRNMSTKNNNRLL